MESRKKRNQQIESKKRMERRIGTAIIVIIVALMLTGIVYAVWDTMNRSTILTYRGNRVPTSDFRYFHGMLGAPEGDEETKQMAMDGMLRTLAVIERAEKHGLSVSDEEMADLEQEATGIRDWFSMMELNMRATSDRRIAEFLATGNLFNKDWMSAGPLSELLMDVYVADVRPEQEEIDQFHEDIRDFVIQEASEKIVRYIATETSDSAWDAWMEYSTDEAGFPELMSRFGIPQFDVFDEPIANPISLETFASHFDIGEHWQEINELTEEGDITGAMQIGDLFFVLELYESVLDEESRDQKIAEMTETFIKHFREDAFFDMVEEWVAESGYQINQRAFSRI